LLKPWNEKSSRIVGLTQLETQSGIWHDGQDRSVQGQLQFLKAAVLVAKHRKDAIFGYLVAQPLEITMTRYFELIRFRADCGLEASVIFVPRRDDIDSPH
jgi:hypothetical protein